MSIAPSQHPGRVSDIPTTAQGEFADAAKLPIGVPSSSESAMSTERILRRVCMETKVSSQNNLKSNAHV